MCGICGCSNAPLEDGNHQHLPHHAHTHHPSLVEVEENLLNQNNQYAALNRDYFASKALTAINLMSSPGSGKTTLLAKTIGLLNQQCSMSVVVGDQQTDYDAEAIRQSGGKAIQINTGRVCHLDAHAVGHAVEDLSLNKPGIVFLENVGNLDCPALFDLGERARVVILSVTEGENKPVKYPDMFHHADLIILTKIDLLPYVDFDMKSAMDFIQRVNPGVTMIALSAKTGEGLQAWLDWLLLLHAQ